MKKMKRLVTLALALGLTLTLAACGNKSGLSTFDAKAYVEGLLKETYLGEFDKGYMTLVGITEDEARETYENSLDVEPYYFYYFYDISYPGDEFHEKMMDLYKRIYAHAKFEVVSAAEQDDGSFSVKVSVEPINIIQLAEDKYEEALEPFFTKYENYTEEDYNNMSDEEYAAFNLEYAQMVLDLYESVLPEIGNDEAQSLSVQIEKDEDGYYSLSDSDFDRLDALIINYNVSVSGE